MTVVCIAMMMMTNPVRATENIFTQPINFQLLAEQAEDKAIPIMVLFSSRHCDYCEFVKREYLSPMQRGGEYDSKAVIRVVETDVGDELHDFNGELIDTDVFSERYNIQFIPTVVFMDAKGRELSKRIVGIGNEDFYGGSLDEGIEESLTHLVVYRQRALQ